MDYDVIAKNCINSWNSNNENDESLEFFLNNFSDWISQFDSITQFTLIEMLSIFRYFTHYEINQGLNTLHQKLENDYEITNTNALYTYLKTASGKINSSIDYWLDYKNMHNIDKNYCKDDINLFPNDQWEYLENIVIIDDFCGTGGSLEKFLKSSKKSFKDKTIYYIVICSMKDAKTYIFDLEKEYQTHIIIVYIEEQCKAFDADAIINISNRIDFKKYSESLGISSNYSLGYNESESLVAFYNNTPNNTLGIFWFKTPNSKPIFERNQTKKTPWEMQAERKHRKNTNYESAKKREKYE